MLVYLKREISNKDHREQDKEATVYIGNLDERVTDEMVWELMLQAGRIQGVHLPKDRVTQSHQGFGFVEFVSEDDADYAAKIMNQIRLWGKPIRVNKASADKQKALDVGAELFIGNLDHLLDEHTIYETFSRFGTLTRFPNIARDENGLSRGFGFVSFTDFTAADNAIAAMHGQFLMNKEITVQFALKKDGSGARHGDAAERALAASGRLNNVQPTVEPINLGIVNAPAGTPATSQMQPPAGFGAQQMPPHGFQPGMRNMQPPPLGGMGMPPGQHAGGGGYGGGPPSMPPQGFGAFQPPGMMPPGFGNAPMPNGFMGGPPPGMHPPGMMPMGFGGPPPGMPPVPPGMYNGMR